MWNMLLTLKNGDVQSVNYIIQQWGIQWATDAGILNIKKHDCQPDIRSNRTVTEAIGRIGECHREKISYS
jgi:hypothetical protein